MRAISILFAPTILAALLPRQDGTSGAQSAASNVQSGAESAASGVMSGTGSAATGLQSGTQSGAAPAAMTSSPAAGDSNGSANVTTSSYGMPDNATVSFPNVTIPARCDSVCNMYGRVTDACRTNATGDACLAICGEEWAPFDTCLECLDDADVPGEDQLEDQQEVLEALCLRSGRNPHASLAASGNITINFPNSTVPQTCQDQCSTLANVTQSCSTNSSSDACLSVCAPEMFTKFRLCVRCLDKADDEDDDDDNDKRRRRKRDSNDFDDAEDKIEMVCRANGKDPRAGANTTVSAVNMPADAQIPQQCQVMCPSYSKYAGTCSGNANSTDCMQACQPAEFRLLDLCIECLDDHADNLHDIDDELDHLEDICRAQGHDPKFAANSTGNSSGGSGNNAQGGAQGERANSSPPFAVPIATVLVAAVLALL